MKSQKVKNELSKMPPLAHWQDRTRPFQIRDSEVVAWICKQPEVCQWLFNAARTSGSIKFDSATGLWKGFSQ